MPESKSSQPGKDQTDDRIRILVVDDDLQRGLQLIEMLAAQGYAVAGTADASEYLPDRVRQVNPDVILIDINMPSRDTLEQISILNRELPRPVVMFTADKQSSMTREAIEAGVSAYVVEGLSEERVKPVIEVALAHFQKYQQVQDELAQARIALYERKVIERAKGILMEQLSIKEPDAYKKIRSMAMNRNRKIVDVSQDIIAMADLFKEKPTSPQPDFKTTKGNCNDSK